MNVLIVKASSMGDIVHSFPVLDFLKRKNPNVQIDWVVEKPYAGLLTSHPYIRELLYVDTKKWRKNYFLHLLEIFSFVKQLRKKRYDIVFDLQGNSKSGFITWNARAPVKVGFDRTNVTEWVNTLASTHRYKPPAGNNIYDDYLFLPRSYFNDFVTPTTTQIDLGGKASDIPKTTPLIMICPGSAWPNKQLTPATLHQFLHLVHQKTQCTYIYIWGNEEEKKLATQLQNSFGGYIPDRLSIPDLQALMRNVNLVIGMDSMALHLAGTTSTPTFGIFGPSLATRYHPLGSQHAIFQGPCPYNQPFEKRCPILRKCSTGACMHDINPTLLFERFSNFFHHGVHREN